MFDLYRQQILDRYKNPRFIAPLANKTHEAEGANMACGDEVRWELSIQNGIIKEAHHHTRACAICTASADLLAEALEGKPSSSIKEYDQKKITELLGIPLSPTRLKCALLPLETMKQALKTDSN